MIKTVPEQRITLPTKMSFSVIVSIVDDVDAMVYGSGPGVPRAVTTPRLSSGCLRNDEKWKGKKKAIVLHI